MDARGSAKGLAAWCFCLTALAGCSGASGIGTGAQGSTSTVATISSGATGTVPVITRTPALPTAATPAPSAPVCIIEMPAQIGDDNTPITFVHFGEDAEQCALEVAKMNDPDHGSATQGPAKIAYAIPAGSPMCTGTRPDGLRYAIYGTLAAMQACGA